MHQYNCPYCSAHLNVNGYIVFSFKRKYGKSGIILMNEELGNYSFHVNPEITFDPGEKTEFHCPSCSKSLEFEHDKSKVRIFKIDESGEQHAVIFSAIFGEKLTYQLSEERQLSFGEHALKYLDPTWYMKT